MLRHPVMETGVTPLVTLVMSKVLRNKVEVMTRQRLRPVKHRRPREDKPKDRKPQDDKPRDEKPRVDPNHRLLQSFLWAQTTNGSLKYRFLLAASSPARI